MEASAHHEEKGAAEQFPTPHQGGCAPAYAHREERAEERAGDPEQSGSDVKKQEPAGEEAAQPPPPLSRSVWLKLPALRAWRCRMCRKGSSPTYNRLPTVVEEDPVYSDTFLTDYPRLSGACQHSQ